jgi:hypothetical protein
VENEIKKLEKQITSLEKNSETNQIRKKLK